MMPKGIPLADLFKLTRAGNLAIVVVTQFFTAYFLVGPPAITAWRLYVLAGSTVFIAAAGYIINDYYDVKIDLINKPDRVVVGKSIRRRHALFLHWALSVSGVVLGFAAGWRVGAVHFFCGFLLWWYSNQLKRLPLVGNISVALLTALSVFVVAILFNPYSKIILMYALFAFFINMLREVVKDMEDLKGDDTFGCRTLPIVWGLRPTKMFLYFLSGLMTVAVAGINMVYVGISFLIIVCFVIAPVAFFVVRLSTADTTKDFHWLSQYCKAVLLAGVLSMAFV